VHIGVGGAFVEGKRERPSQCVRRCVKREVRGGRAQLAPGLPAAAQVRANAPSFAGALFMHCNPLQLKLLEALRGLADSTHNPVRAYSISLASSTLRAQRMVALRQIAARDRALEPLSAPSNLIDLIGLPSLEKLEPLRSLACNSSSNMSDHTILVGLTRRRYRLSEHLAPVSRARTAKAKVPIIAVDGFCV
jgi:hypothetical protein